MPSAIITTCTNSQPLAKKIAKQLKAQYSPLTIKNFPDGDLYLKFNTSLKNHTLIIIHSFQPNPNQSLLRILFAAKTARDLGTKKIILVAPYLSFMRQDKRFHEGEAISARIMAQLLSQSIDKLITIDPHLHRIPKLSKIFTIPTKALTANLLIADYIKKHFRNEIIIGPDWESYQWAENIAKHIHLHATILKKARFTARKVKVKMIKPIKIKNKNIIIVDDIISTGHTIIQAAKQLKKFKPKTISTICVHPLFVENALKKLKQAGIKRIISTNTIQHPTNKIDISPLIINELKK